ncbi:MAG: hypothetical protein KDA28_15065, partial [Phycisphaerales bacterium]|nr:hypothetical protein [Phycisphaerales bacterium]
MADSRWIELVDTTYADDPREPRVEWIVPPDDRRYFFALRAVDLSALVNLNTATDFVVPPTNLHPSGATPSDIDLRRLLINRDAFDDTLLTYADLQLPLGALTNVPGNYQAYGFDFSAPANAQLQVGRFAYEAVQQANLFGAVPFTGTSVAPGWTSFQTPAGRRLNYEFFGRRAGLGEGAMFGLEDQAELMTFWGLNDPDVRSQLEQATGGRFLALPNLSPLRDNRPASLERDSLDDQQNNGNPFNNGPFAADGELDGNGAVFQAVDLRRRLTTISASSLQRSGGHAFTIPELGESVGGTRDLTSDFDPARVDDPDRFDELDFRLNLRRFMTEYVFKAGTQPEVDVYPLFRMYADLLMPWSGVIEGFGDTWEVDDENRSLHYGHLGPELSLRFAAHLAANLIDSYDDDTTTSAFTVTARNLTGVPVSLNDEVLSPWLQRDQVVVETDSTVNRYERALDLDAALTQGVVNQRRRLARTPAPLVSAERVNVYGIEAQPFLTEAASFVIYTDASEQVGGDVDYGPEPVNPGDPVEQITINGDINLSGNIGFGGLGDFAGMFVAFQLHNPFDVDIRLTSQTLGNGSVPTQLDDAFDYYIEFGGRYFRLAEYDSTANEYQAITMRPGETMVVYVTAVPHTTLDSRWDALAQAYNPGADVPTSREWIRKQLGADDGMRVVQIRQMNPRTGDEIPGNADILDPIPSVNPDTEPGSSPRVGTIQEVRLWRRLEFDGSSIGQPNEDNGSSRRNIMGNDMLVDRMSEPAIAVNPALAGLLDQRLPPGQHEVDDTESFDESSTNSDNDNTGFTLVRYASFRRPDAPGNPIRGSIPAYCVERKGGVLNAGDEGPIGYGNLDDSDFSSGDPHTDFTFAGMVDRTPNNIIIDTIGDEPDDKSGEPIGANLFAQTWTDVTTEMGVDDREYEASVDGDTVSVLRIRDLLMPFAVGPESLAIQGDVTLLKYTTLSEWFAVITGYDDCSDTQKWDPLYVGLPFHVDPTATPTERQQPFLLDEGRLRLDRFVSFVNVDGNIDPDLGPVFNPPRDLRVGSGIPMALGVYDMFAEPVWTDMGWNNGDDTFRDEKIAGRINVNTATRHTLRTVPLLSPTYDVATPPGSSPRNFTWWGPITPLPGNPATAPYFDVEATGTGSDIASSVLAYRDRQESVLFRA